MGIEVKQVEAEGKQSCGRIRSNKCGLKKSVDWKKYGLEQVWIRSNQCGLDPISVEASWCMWESLLLLTSSCCCSSVCLAHLEETVTPLPLLLCYLLLFHPFFSLSLWVSIPSFSLASSAMWSLLWLQDNKLHWALNIVDSSGHFAFQTLLGCIGVASIQFYIAQPLSPATSSYSQQMVFAQIGPIPSRLPSSHPREFQNDGMITPPPPALPRKWLDGAALKAGSGV